MEIRHRKNTKGPKSPKGPLPVILALAISCAVVYGILSRSGSSSSNNNNNNTASVGGGAYSSNPAVVSPRSKQHGSGLGVTVLYPVYNRHHGSGETNSSSSSSSSSVTEKLMEDLQNSPSVGALVGLDTEDPPRAVLESCGRGSGTNSIATVSTASDGRITSGVLERFEALRSSRQPQLALELLKYCALDHYGGGLYLDSRSSLSSTLENIVSKQPGGSIAVLNDPQIAPDSIHGGLLYVGGSSGASKQSSAAAASNKKKKQKTGSVVGGMIAVLLSTDVKILESSPLLLPKSLYGLIAKDIGVKELDTTTTTTTTSNSEEAKKKLSDSDWYLLRHSCNLSTSGPRQLTVPIASYALNSHRLNQHCVEPSGFCCSIFDPINFTPTMMTKHLLLPYQVLPPASDLPKPLHADSGEYDELDLPYISTISERVHPKPQDHTHLTPNFFETLLQNDCLPSDKKCSDCLRNKNGANCKSCASVCPCYCKALCHVPVEEKFVSKSLVVSPPLYAKDPSRLVPRIIHQTYFEEVTTEKYPNMSRLIESFKQSGWHYKFYTDEMSLNFLSTHFPPEVREAYETLRPGAFKADLFRYCVLLIHGGVYADMDIMLEANLDIAVAPDIGFMVPQDEPGIPVNRRMCLWNGFIASAPGHPFLAKTIETIVNNIRNRFTSVDTDNMFCPHPELSMLHAYDTLFTAGPCILGAMVNKVLGRDGQSQFEAGDIDLWERGKQSALEKGTEFVIGVDDKPNKKIPGRVVILSQNKWDMGSHRFTFLEKNLVVAATDLPDSDDRANQETTKEHYSKTHVKAGIYGLDRLYTDNVRANEEMRFYVDAQWSRYINRDRISRSSISGTTAT